MSDRVSGVECLACKELFMFVIEPVKVHRLVCPFCYSVTVIDTVKKEIRSG